MEKDRGGKDVCRSNAKNDTKLEVAVIPVSDVDRAKHFYQNLGWRLDADFVRSDGSRAVQFTPPGSPCSIHLGAGPKPLLFLIVSDVEVVRAELVDLGIDTEKIDAAIA